MERYAVVIEKGKHRFGVSVPAPPVCVAPGETGDEIRKLSAEAITFRLEGMRENGESIPLSRRRHASDPWKVGRFV
jgi:predicted RNase H-like HicB family nuclease